ncbi:UNVERIFIED_CONTAM: hypothetical protein HDU68_011097 [Siphonaria sp. JEL0065]|nr:hypothetical protein HDU68_011097 [Siphonaria sp. JEL0065]
MNSSELLQRLEAAHQREAQQRKIFALGLLIAAGVTAAAGINAENIRNDLTEHIRSTDARLTALETQTASSKPQKSEYQQ